MRQLLCLLLLLVSNYAQAEIKGRAELRERLISHFNQFVAPVQPGDNDQVAALVDEVRYRSLTEIESRGLTKASIPTALWSDTYWPLYRGGVAAPYADPNFPGAIDWKENSDYIMKSLGSTNDLDNRSPAEKYDLLVGDKNFSLTKAVLASGQEIFEREGKVDFWMGICHGWAPASYMAARPVRAFKALAADGQTQITFYPSDVKALLSLLWAEGTFPARFVGGRCNEQNPPADPQGRPTDPDCLDTNPATFHLALVNQIGVAQRSFIMDASASLQVWNQPIISYEYELFNPKTHAMAKRVKDAIVKREDFKNDPYKNTRSPGAIALVGVSMTVTYGTESEPDHNLVDTGEKDHSNSVTYQYDLELDSKGIIVGGEWHGPTHPDFLWTPEKGAKAESIGDAYLDRSTNRDSWPLATKPMPLSWSRLASLSSTHEQPMARVVSALVHFANPEMSH